MNAGPLWMLAGIAICGAELLYPGVFLLWIGLAAVAAGGIIAAAHPGPAGQVVTFLMALAVLLSVPIVRRRRLPRYDGGINAPDSQLIGKTCRALSFDGSEGRVGFRDGTWQARISGGPSPAPGTLLRIVGLEGTTLLVAEAGEPRPMSPPPDAV